MKRLLALLGGLGILSSLAAPTVLAESFELDSLVDIPEAEAADHYVDSFVISAYYSPLPGQNRYATGSYEADLRLNGNGTHFADGTPVYYGGIAAPKIFRFGTVLDIPGIGVTRIHDRGGAIVPAGQRGYAHHRLDVWMGHGDEGLIRALNWGKRTIPGVKVYGIDDELKTSVYVESYSAVESFIQNTVLQPDAFPSDIFFGTQDEAVAEMQEHLKDWHYYEGEVDGLYDADTAQALFNFQLDFDIVDGTDELGAGHFGIKTRTQFDKLINAEDSSDMVIQNRGSALMAKYSDLYEEMEYFGAPLEKGDNGILVSKLQEELNRLGYLRLAPTGQFGEITEHAVFKFQQAHGLVSSKTDAGAGFLGPQTRQLLNSTMESRYMMKSYLAFNRDRYQEAERNLALLTEAAIARLED